MNTIQATLLHWIPHRMFKPDPGHCEWLYTGNETFTEPFFTDSISVCRKLRENCSRYKIVSHLDVLEPWSAGLPPAAPTAIIFHVSRCASTLLSQLLSLDTNHFVLSEVPFFDEILRLSLNSPRYSEEDTSRLLRAAIKLYCAGAGEGRSRLFIKSDSWHLHFYHQLRALFPGTPFILLYRNPWEVIQSHQKRRGMQSVPGIIEPSVFGLNAMKAHETNLDKYLAYVLQSYFDKMIGIAMNDPLAFPVNYAEGAATIIRNIYAFTQMELSASMENAFEERIRYHAKYPRQLFSEENDTFHFPDYVLPVMRSYRYMDELSLLKY